MGAIGSGKTTLITRLVEKLKDRMGVAVFNGDATTSNDADPIAGFGVPVVQIATINGCHLDANVVGKACAKIDLAKLEAHLHREHRQPDLPGGISARLQGARRRRQRHRGAVDGAQASAHVHGRAARRHQQDRAGRHHGRQRRPAHRRRAQAQARPEGHPRPVARPARASTTWSRRCSPSKEGPAMHELSIASSIVESVHEFCRHAAAPRKS